MRCITQPSHRQQPDDVVDVPANVVVALCIAEAEGNLERAIALVRGSVIGEIPQNAAIAAIRELFAKIAINSGMKAS